MALQLTIDLRDLGRPKFEEALRAFPSESARVLRRAVDKATLKIEGGAKSRAPARTGTLRRSIHAEAASVQGSSIVGKVGTALSYAPFQEYGVRAHGPVRARALRFQVGGKVVFARRVRRFAGRFFMRGSFEANRTNVQRFFEEAVADLTRLLAGR